MCVCDISGLARWSRLHVILSLRGFLCVCENTCNHVRDSVCAESTRKKEVQTPPHQWLPEHSQEAGADQEESEACGCMCTEQR